jgi:sensor histidine kinase YesM
MVVGSLPQLNKGEHIHFSDINLVFTSIAIIPGVISYYYFYSILFSKYLIQNKITLFIASGIAVSLISTLIGWVILWIAVSFKMGYHGFRITAPIFMILILIAFFFNAMANGIVGLIMRGFITSYGDIKLKEDLNKKNYEMELALVKSQINPHFLFNTLNNIDVLIQKDAVKASEYLNKLSDIMRFMLYETKTEKISLTKELMYIEKYIELQKIRTSNLNYVNYSVEGDTDDLLITPMLFIPFIENAFKYAENRKIENAINIKVIIEKEKLLFECENNYTEAIQAVPNQNGLGNELIQKRLALLYPDKHTLEISTKNNMYKVKLILL